MVSKSSTSVMCRTTVVTGPPPENYDFKSRVIGGVSLLGSVLLFAYGKACLSKMKRHVAAHVLVAICSVQRHDDSQCLPVDDGLHVI